jgi:hypothetical protein
MCRPNLKLSSAGKFEQEEGVVTVFKLVIAPIEKVTSPLEARGLRPPCPRRSAV